MPVGVKSKRQGRTEQMEVYSEERLREITNLLVDLLQEIDLILQSINLPLQLYTVQSRFIHFLESKVKFMTAICELMNEMGMECFLLV